MSDVTAWMDEETGNVNFRVDFDLRAYEDEIMERLARRAVIANTDVDGPVE